MTPMQAFHSLSELRKVRKLIVGGAYVSTALQKALINAKVNAFETYGMMETLSHIAVRGMKDPISEFRCLPDIQVRQDERKCLIIDAPKLNIENLITNDEVEVFNTKHFRLIGRIDYMIEIGSLKLNPEQIERKLSEYLSIHFFIDSYSDSTSDKKLALVVKYDPKIKLEKIYEQLKNCISLEDYEIPKVIVCFESFIQTYSGKIKRKSSMKQKPYRILNL